MSIGDRIKHARKTVKMTQQELAGSQFTKGYISQIENGIVEPSMKVLSLIASKLDKPISYFLGEDDIYHKSLEYRYIEGENLFKNKNYHGALPIFKEIVLQAENHGGVIYSSSLLYLGKCFSYQKEYTESIKLLKKSISLLEELSLYEKAVESYLYLGYGYFELKFFTEAIEAFEGGIQLIENKSLNADKYKAKLLLNIATSYQQQGRLNQAIVFYERAEVFCRQESIIDTLLDCHVRKGYINYKLNRIDEAKKEIVKANLINVVLGYDIVWTEIYNILGMIVFKEGSAQKAVKLLGKSMGICKKIRYDWGMYVNIIDLISISLENKELDEVNNLIEDNRKKIKNLGDERIYCLLKCREAKLLFLRGNTRESIELYKEAIDHFIQLGMRWEIYHHSKELAEILILSKNPSDSKKYYDLSLKAFSEL